MTSVFRPATALSVAQAHRLSVHAGRGGYDPIQEFGAISQGFVYDPYDLSTLWQDSTGLTLGAVGQPVSIMLDKRFGLRRDAELMPADLSGGTLSSNVTLINGNTQIRFNGAALNAKADFTPNATVDNVMFYEVFFTVSNYSSGSVRLRLFATGEVGEAYVTGISGNGTYRALIDPTPGGGGINQKIRIESMGGSGNTFDVSNVSIRPVPGNHVWTTDTTARPILTEDANGLRYLAHDGVNDGLQSVALAGLGLGYPLTLVCAVKANNDSLSSILSVWGGAPPYYEIQKSGTVSQFRAFVRGAVNVTASETVGTIATPHVAMATFTSTDADLELDGVNSAAAQANTNAFGAVTEIRVGYGGGAYTNGRFYGGAGFFGTLSAQSKANLRRFYGRKAGLQL